MVGREGVAEVEEVVAVVEVVVVEGHNPNPVDNL